MENNEIKLDNGFGITYTFKIVDKAPADYIIWNIPTDGLGEYIPFCQLIPDDEGWKREVNRETLVAVKLENAKQRKQIMNGFAMHGLNSLRCVRREMKKNNRKMLIPSFELAESILLKLQEEG